MKWKRGLFQAWIIASAAWTVFVLVDLTTSINAADHANEFVIWRPVLMALGPWAITAAGLGLAWSLRGFHSR